MVSSHGNVLEIEGLRTTFTTHEGEIKAVDGVSFSIRRGTTMALVGESGCGKSVTAYSILRLVQKPGRIVGGRVLLHASGRPPLDITALGDKDEQLYDVRGGLISMIFQEPMTALSPVHTIGNQICEAILLHQDATQEEAEQRAVAMLGKVGIPGPEPRLTQYPHELSGGMRQRVVIAMALVCNPELLIADEPTTALDVTIQAQVLKLIKGLQEEMGTSVLLITHDLGVVAQVADDVAVRYLGRIVERSDVRTVLKRPRHPYTIALLESLPSLHIERERLPSIDGSVPSLTAIPAGCPFHPRCPFMKDDLCTTGPPPPLRRLAEGHDTACIRAEAIVHEGARQAKGDRG